jgi:predicted amidohydrolase YtcJ
MAAVIPVVMAVACNSSTQPSDMIITNARIWTGNGAQPYAEAMAVSGDTIIAIGSSRELLKFKSGTDTVIDLGGRFVVPGFIDSHIHMLQGGSILASVQLRDAATPEVFINRIREYAATLKPGSGFSGGLGRQRMETLPHRKWIDSVTPDNPVFVSRLDGHMALANSAAMKIAGADQRVKDVAGGSIERDENGEPTGIFKDNAMDLISLKIPEQSAEEVDRALVSAMKYLASNGVTSANAC